MKVKITLNMTVAKTVEVPDGLDQDSLYDAILDATPSIGQQWDTFAVHSERYAGPEHADGSFGPLQFTTFDKSALLYDIMKSAHRDPRTLELLEQLCAYADDEPPVN